MFLFWNRISWSTCYDRYCIFGCGFVAFVGVSPYGESSPWIRIRDSLLTFCWCCMIILIRICILLRVIDATEKEIIDWYWGNEAYYKFKKIKFQMMLVEPNFNFKLVGTINLLIILLIFIFNIWNYFVSLIDISSIENLFITGNDEGGTSNTQGGPSAPGAGNNTENGEGSAGGNNNGNYDPNNNDPNNHNVFGNLGEWRENSENNSDNESEAGPSNRNKRPASFSEDENEDEKPVVSKKTRQDYYDQNLPEGDECKSGIMVPKDYHNVKSKCLECQRTDIRATEDRSNIQATVNYHTHCGHKSTPNEPCHHCVMKDNGLSNWPTPMSSEESSDSSEGGWAPKKPNPDVSGDYKGKGKAKE